MLAVRTFRSVADDLLPSICFFCSFFTCFLGVLPVCFQFSCQ